MDIHIIYISLAKIQVSCSYLIEREAGKYSLAVYPGQKRNRYTQFIEPANLVSFYFLLSPSIFKDKCSIQNVD